MRDPNGRDPNGRDPNGRDPNGRDPIGRDPIGRDPNGRDPIGRELAGCCLDTRLGFFYHGLKSKWIKQSMIKPSSSGSTDHEQFFDAENQKQLNVADHHEAIINDARSKLNHLTHLMALKHQCQRLEDRLAYTKDKAKRPSSDGSGTEVYAEFAESIVDVLDKWLQVVKKNWSWLKSCFAWSAMPNLSDAGETYYRQLNQQTKWVEQRQAWLKLIDEQTTKVPSAVIEKVKTQNQDHIRWLSSLVQKLKQKAQKRERQKTAQQKIQIALADKESNLGQDAQSNQLELQRLKVMKSEYMAQKTSEENLHYIHQDLGVLVLLIQQIECCQQVEKQLNKQSSDSTKQSVRDLNTLKKDLQNLYSQAVVEQQDKQSHSHWSRLFSLSKRIFTSNMGPMAIVLTYKILNALITTIALSLVANGLIGFWLAEVVSEGLTILGFSAYLAFPMFVNKHWLFTEGDCLGSRHLEVLRITVNVIMLCLYNPLIALGYLINLVSVSRYAPRSSAVLAIVFNALALSYLSPVMAYAYLVSLVLTPICLPPEEWTTPWTNIKRRLGYFLNQSGQIQWSNLWLTASDAFYFIYMASMVVFHALASRLSLGMVPLSVLLLLPATLYHTLVEEVLFRSPLVHIAAWQNRLPKHRLFSEQSIASYPKLTAWASRIINKMPMILSALLFGGMHMNQTKQNKKLGQLWPLLYVPVAMNWGAHAMVLGGIESAWLAHVLNNFPLFLKNHWKLFFRRGANVHFASSHRQRRSEPETLSPLSILIDTGWDILMIPFVLIFNLKVKVVVDTVKSILVKPMAVISKQKTKVCEAQSNAGYCIQVTRSPAQLDQLLAPVNAKLGLNEDGTDLLNKQQAGMGLFSSMSKDDQKPPESKRNACPTV